MISDLPEETVAMSTRHARGQGPPRASGPPILVHGKNDELIPYTESIALDGATAPSRSRVIIVNNALGHVDLRFSGLLSMQFWTKELPDAFRVLRAVALLMREREPVSVSAPPLDRSRAGD